MHASCVDPTSQPTCQYQDLVLCW